jgi:hypothetical protein
MGDPEQIIAEPSRAVYLSVGEIIGHYYHTPTHNAQGKILV